MTVTLRTERIRTTADIEAFLKGSEGADLAALDREEAYDFIRRTLVGFRYHFGATRKEKGLVRKFLVKVTGYSNSHLTKLIRRQRETGGIRDRRKKPPARPFPTRYTAADIALLAEADEILGYRSGPRTMKVLRRQFEVYGDERYERLAYISNGHFYELRKRRPGPRAGTSFLGTKASPSQIGTRRKPRPEGRPGFVRADTVHSGDRGSRKGAYYVNVVDEVTQYQHVACVPRITERFMLPVLEDLLAAFPFRILGFHSDNGSEYVNRPVAAMLAKLHGIELTKSRPRHSNDNALAESKNGSTIRRLMGRFHVPARLAPRANVFLRDVYSPLLNYHQPCHFPVEIIRPDGRRTWKYPQKNVRTPYRALRSLPDAGSFLKPGVTFAQLDAKELAQSDLDANRQVNRERDKLFSLIDKAIDNYSS